MGAQQPAAAGGARAGAEGISGVRSGAHAAAALPGGRLHLVQWGVIICPCSLVFCHVALVALL